jgi:hypothetical protein
MASLPTSPLHFAVSTRFLRRVMQKQQTRNSNGLSIINFSRRLLLVDCFTFTGDGMDFTLLLKHDGIIYIFVTQKYFISISLAQI